MALDDLRRMMLSAALMGAGGRMMSAAQGTPGQPGPGLGGVLGAGTQGFAQGMGQYAAMMPLMMRMQQQEQQRQRLQKLTAGLPERQRMMAEIAPAQFVAGQFRKPVAPYSPIGKLQADLAAGRITRPQYEQGVQAMQRPPIQMMPGETEEAKSLAKIRTEAFKERQTEGRAAQKALTNLNALEPLLQRAEAGPGTPEAVRVKRGLSGAARALGFDETASLIEGEDVPAAEAATSVANRLTLSLKNVFNLGVRGFDTPAEREFVQNLSPGLGTTPQGRKVLFPLLRKMYGRQMEMAKEARAYLRRRGTLRGVDDHLDEKFSGKPVFTKEEMDKALEAPGTVPTIGEVRKGYRFLGGDPSNPQSWQKVQ